MPWVVQPAPAPPAFYVATNGSDSNPGSLAQPFLTLGQCQRAMQASGSRTCYVRGGAYSTPTLTLGASDANETWSYYPADTGMLPAVGAALTGEPRLTQTSAAPFFTLGAGADNVTIIGFNAAGFSHSTAVGSCTGAQFVVANGVSNLTVTHNTGTGFDCGAGGTGNTNLVFGFNLWSIIEYAGEYCDACTGAPGQTIWQGGVISNINTDGHAQNGYPVVFSTSGGQFSTNFTVQNYAVYNSPNWECYDNHAGASIRWINNLCVGPGHNTAINSVALSNLLTLSNIQQIGNILDLGSTGTLIDSLVMCGDGSPPCGTSSDITGGSIVGNTVRFGTANGCVIAASPVVAVGSNTCGLAPEVVSSITFTNGANIWPLTPGQPNAVVATLAVNMSDTSWAFPFPPGTLSIGGANSGGFVICNQNQLCQPAGGTSAGVYRDFTLTATLHGMAGSPFTMPAGSLIITSGFYIATNGNDGNPGTLAQPFASVAACATAVAATAGKGCFMRGGTYSYASAPAAHSCQGYGQAIYLTAPIILTDYPPDGFGSPVLDGGNNATTLQAICVDGTAGSGFNNVTVNGLTFNHWQGGAAIYSANMTPANAAQNWQFTNNTVTNNTYVPCCIDPFDAGGYYKSLLVANNYFANGKRHGLSISPLNVAGSANLVTGNLVQNECGGNTDCGDLYVIGSNTVGCQITGGLTLSGNYTAGGAGSEAHVGIYLDSGTCGVAVTGNVVVVNGYHTCLQNHSNSNDTFTGNICDLGGGGGASATDIVFYQYLSSLTGSNSMTGNLFRGNFVTCGSSSSPCGSGYVGNSSPPTPMTISSNGYHNYGTGTGGVGGVGNAGSGGAGTEAGATSVPSPGVTCPAAISPPSALLLPPVSMIPPAAGWGPFNQGVPAGTAPSWGPC